MQCSNCRFFNVGETQCRRYAPQPATTGGKAEWPTVSASEWCGEYAAVQALEHAAA